MSSLIDLIGKRFGRLTVLERAAAPENSGGSSYWHCYCDCGVSRIVRGASMRIGETVSCGCHARDQSRKRVKHGAACGKKLTPEYYSWMAMKNRCNNPKSVDFKWYGARGIKVCLRWRQFENFLADMGRRPDGMTLDRYPDLDGDYEPANCRWATRQQQSQNRRRPWIKRIAA